MVKRIAITGPESTGKSTLASDLARYYKTEWVPEYAREFLDDLSRPYEYEDIVEIAKGQLTLEDKYFDDAVKLLFCDTELIVTKIWSEFKYNKCDPWILDELSKNRYDLYLLTDIDIPWQEDPLREHPEYRIELFNIYKNEILSRNLPHIVINGSREERLMEAVKHIDKLLNNS